MAWIKTIPCEEAKGTLKKAYDRVKGPNNYLDNILTIHSLRPHSLEGHVRLYKNVLHHFSNEIPKWFLEAMGVFTSLLNGCTYCVSHHFTGVKRLLKDDQKADKLLKALKSEDFHAFFSEKESAMLKYTKKLAVTPWLLTEKDITELRNVGYDDGKILEANQVISYFCYANRTVLGLSLIHISEPTRPY